MKPLPPRALRVLAALLFASALAAEASAEDTLKVGKAVPNAFSFTPLDVGMQTGIFARHGLKIESYGMGGSARLQQGLIAGSLDIGLGSGPELAFMAKGSPVLGVAAMAHEPSLLDLVVKKDGPIRRIADLKGKTITVSTAGSLTEWLVREISRQQGWGPEGIKATPLGAPTAQVAALKTGQTDGMLTDLGLAFNLDRQGVGRTLLNFGDIVKDFHTHVIYASKPMRDERPDALRRFLAGWFETIAFVRKNKERTVEIVGPIMNTTPDETAKIWDKLAKKGFFSDDGRFHQKALATLSKSFVELGTLDTEPDMSKTYTEAFLPAPAKTN
jgi:ABC-type nitrate/sulfonate/bicarbonate transport system substrate-binding protein